MCGSAAPEHELEEVFGVGYPPDPALQISEPQISELPDKLTTIRQTVAFGVAFDRSRHRLDRKYVGGDDETEDDPAVRCSRPHPASMTRVRLGGC